MASKHLKIKFNKKGGRMKQTLLKAEEEWLLTFLDRPDISRQTPGRKDNVYIGKVNGKREYAQKRYLQWTIRELLDIVNGNSEVEGSPTFQEDFQRDLTFRQLYDFLKKRKQYKFSNQTPHESCTCEICENIRLLVTAVNRKMKNIDARLPSTVNDLIAEFTCQNAGENCMKSLCEDCPTVKINEEDFLDQDSASAKSTNDDNSDSETEEDDDITFYQWVNVDGKAA
eukprot:TCONS_00041134-protein